MTSVSRGSSSIGALQSLRSSFKVTYVLQQDVPGEVRVGDEHHGRQDLQLLPAEGSHRSWIRR